MSNPPTIPDGTLVEDPRRNPFAQTVEEQIAALRLANEEEGWGIPDETIERLAETAPEWPEGRDTYRSFRIRFGEGDEGVTKTFEAHIARIERVHGDEKFWCYGFLRSAKAHPRLLSGNASHTPVVEWCILHLDANRERESIEAVRGSDSIADEGLVVVWLFPKRADAINYNEWCAWFCAGYELNVPGDEQVQPCVPCVFPGLIGGRVGLDAYFLDICFSSYSVPTFEG